ncbi:hypothetical protein [Pseudonocardia oroxyli]|uniref:STAS domain-containing protein n=1 Tax=Pseudonocardia oroxyli TaxID=366584 RepID=A0A1G7G9H1_PSEOR|nr:hypothetical protein [Pseudonocardia oroxyli]SDE84770.1 hypothetical protein SAMN05216377_102266 [Pseudonocardia oroxyli]
MTVSPLAPSLSVRTVDPSTYVIGVTGDLDAVTVVRLLRLLDARLALPSTGRPTTDAVHLDLTRAERVAPGALVALKHARHSCARRRVELTLVVDDDLADRVAPRDRAELGRHRLSSEWRAP